MKFKRNYKKIFLYLSIPPCLILIVSVALYYIYIVKYPGDQIKKETIMNLISLESPVYYEDGKNIVGVFFNKEHRRYLKINRTKIADESEEDFIPERFIQALIATEDKKFYKHFGFNPKSIVRAAVANIMAGRVVQGGSTLTQQTVKNIFRRKKRSMSEKFNELVNALRLEYHYTKDEILEFYCNQFYVNGNGRGLGVAALYFFDKQAKDLSLLETAFIVASLKGPDWYNSFIKHGETKKEATHKRARGRVDYVLHEMYSLNMINKEEYDNAVKEKLNFKQGTFRFANNVIMDYIRNKLESPKFTKLLDEHGISNLANSGIKIYSTLDAEVQKGLLYSLRSHLSSLQTRLYGYKKPSDSPVKPLNLNKLNEKEFYIGTIKDLVYKTNKSYFTIDFGNAEGTVNYKGLKRFAGKLKNHRLGYYSKPGLSNVKSLFKKFTKDDLIYVSVLKKGSDSNNYLLDIQQYPEINGGGIVLDKGEIKGLAGGFTNLGYNRALYAKREPGSVFKPILFLAALTLNWSNMDELINKRNVFVFQNQFYYPKPDHKPKSDIVSMVFAGVESENIASVYLLSHLTDKLNKEQFIKIASIVGLTQQDGENDTEYISRIRDTNGIVSTEGQFKRGIFDLIKDQFNTELKFLKADKEIFTYNYLNYGLNFDKQITMINKKLNQKKLSKMQKAELRKRRDILKRNFLHIKRTNNKLKENSNILSDSLVENTISSSLIDDIDAAINEKFAVLKKYKPYAIDKLYYHKDFRTLVGLKYIIKMLKTLGTHSPLKPVLSFPLGSNSVSLYETALAYQTMLEGKTYSFSKDINKNEVAVIKKIEDYDGNIIYEYNPSSKQVIDKALGNMVSSILRKVVTLGTGKKADRKVRVTGTMPETDETFSFKFPVFGKTGTTNKYTTAGFVGFLPKLLNKEEGLTIGKSFTIATYVGHDDNKPMIGKKDKIKIAGASGALPIWIGTANHIIDSRNYADKIDFVEMTFRSDNKIPISITKDSVEVPADPISGLPIFESPKDQKTFTIATFADKSDMGITLNRYFKPVGGLD